MREHFQYAAEKANKVVAALSGLLPNLNGPGKSSRKQYLNTVHSVFLYGAPV